VCDSAEKLEEVGPVEKDKYMVDEHFSQVAQTSQCFFACGT